MSKTSIFKKTVIVLGVGRVGKAIALDLAEDYDVISIDSSEHNLNQIRSKKIKAIKEDITDVKKVSPIINKSDLVVVALPGFLAFSVLKNIIGLGKNIVDISFFPEDPFKLDKLAKKMKVKVLVDCGVAPGLSNIILGYHHKRMSVNNFKFYVGGLPKLRIWPYEYKAAWSPIDVIEEYVRPARQIENGILVTKPALSDLELVVFENIGTLEAFNTDGLRTLLKTIPIKNMQEKTLRFPGHAEYMRLLRETGFFDSRSIEINGNKISPLEMTSKLLFPLWKLKEGEDEFTVMRIIIEGKEHNRDVRYTYDIFDQYDKGSDLTSMARTTGYSCTAVTRLLLENHIEGTGLIPPEYIGESEANFKFILNYLKNKKIKILKSIK